MDPKDMGTIMQFWTAEPELFERLVVVIREDPEAIRRMVEDKKKAQ
jgi:hypothetical protein